MGINSNSFNADKSKLSGFDNWHNKDWDLYYDVNQKVVFQSRKLNKNPYSLIKSNLELSVHILGKINYSTNIQCIANLKKDFYRLDYKDYVSFLSFDEFIKFDKQRQVLQDLEYIYPSLVKFNVVDSKQNVIHYEIGVLTSKGLEFYNSVNGKHLIWKYYCFRIKPYLLWIAAFGGFVDIIFSLSSFFKCIFGFFSN